MKLFDSDLVCRDCNHKCHCNPTLSGLGDKEHNDEYLDLCPCKECNCKVEE